MKKKYLIFAFLISLIFYACSGKEEIEKIPEVGDYYEPNKPIAFEAMFPSWGRIDQTFVIKGNFPKDTAQIKVYFDKKRAVVINCDGRELYGMVPKQAPGYNSVSLVVGKDSIVPDNVRFKYYQTQSVKTVVGKFEDDRYIEGNLDEARVQNVTGIGVVKGQKGDNIILVEGDWGDRTSFVSFDDNMMMRLTNISYMGAIAVDHTKEKACVIRRDGTRMLYTATREDGWTLNPTGIEIDGNMLPGSLHGGMTYAEDDRYLYLMSEGTMVEVDLVNKEVKKLFTKNDHAAFNGVNLGSWWQYLIYSKYHKCFFVSYADANGIFKVYKDGSGVWHVEKYAGFNSGGTAFGDKLLDAVFRAPCGMAVNSEGEIYVCCKDGHCIVKIRGSLVSLVAGHPDQWGKVNGYPLDAYFDQPKSIAIDSEDNFYVGEGASRVVRKLTIE
ncbi:IPT/TIG domain-containing protein [Dysgonomonas sp. Marseille-P4677]|uniref:IPT/TIG domain-containing protein n=1 Tax=Dysgonomonas sp. Marseille-P4677 TaxID=2364790 RepID=UPI001912D2F8|nr:IPT/TIG domain-containing protein [Dysgonomonas sp. Marseille-P4677]MBK5720341.1 IPT/TIG domain-containing protein [Dysgonomonas sp. Marseille-P4677]